MSKFLLKEKLKKFFRDFSDEIHQNRLYEFNEFMKVTKKKSELKMLEKEFLFSKNKKNCILYEYKGEKGIFSKEDLEEA